MVAVHDHQSMPRGTLNAEFNRQESFRKRFGAARTRGKEFRKRQTSTGQAASKPVRERQASCQEPPGVRQAVTRGAGQPGSALVLSGSCQGRAGYSPGSGRPCSSATKLPQRGVVVIQPCSRSTSRACRAVARDTWYVRHKVSRVGIWSPGRNSPERI